MQGVACTENGAALCESCAAGYTMNARGTACIGLLIVLRVGCTHKVMQVSCFQCCLLVAPVMSLFTECLASHWHCAFILIAVQSRGLVLADVPRVFCCCPHNQNYTDTQAQRHRAPRQPRTLH